MSDEDFLGPVGNASAKYDNGNFVTQRLLRRFLVEVDDLVAAAAPASVLDVGCGEGVVTERITRIVPTARVVGLDAGTDALRRHWDARSTEQLSFVKGSAYDLPFAEREFDLVCAIEVLEHLERPREALLELARVARKGMLLSVPREPLWRISHVLAGRDLPRFGNTRGHINHWSRASFERLAAAFGTVTAVRTPFPWIVVLVDADASVPSVHDDDTV